MRSLRVAVAVAAITVGVACHLIVGAALADAARADDGTGATPAPVTVTIPGVGTNTPSPTPSDSSSPSATPSPPSRSHGGSGVGTATAPPPAPGEEPKVSKIPATGTLKVIITPQQVFAFGDHMTVSVSGMSPGEKVQLVIYYKHGSPQKMGSFVADAAGSLVVKVALPRLDAGTDTVQVTGWDSQKIGAATFLMGADWVGSSAGNSRPIVLGIGGGAGFAALVGLCWFGIVSLRRASTTVIGA